jgi:TRAP-type uncharacterized transport system fused permease subunit
VQYISHELGFLDLSLSIAGLYFYFAILANSNFYQLLDESLSLMIPEQYFIVRRQIKACFVINDKADNLHYFCPLFLSGAFLAIMHHLEISYISLVRYGFLPFLIINFAILFSNRKQINLTSIVLNQRFYIKILDCLIFCCVSLLLIIATFWLAEQIVWIYAEKNILILATVGLIIYVALVVATVRLELSGAIIASKLLNLTYYIATILCVIILIAFSNLPDFMAIFYGIILLLVIILTEDAIKSSFLQQIRLKKPHLAIELYNGLKQLYHAQKSAWLSLIKPVIQSSILCVMFLILYFMIHKLGFLYCPNSAKISLIIMLAFFLPNEIIFLLRYIFLLKLSGMLLFNLDLSNIMLAVILFYSLVAITIFKANIEEQNKHNSVAILIYVLPILMLLNDDILLFSVENIRVIAVIIFIKIVATLAALAAIEGEWVRKNSYFETVALLFSSFILFCPIWFLNEQIAKYLINQNAENAVKYVEYIPALCIILIIYLRQKWSVRIKDAK